MMTVHEVSRLTGVSIRTLQYYDRIGLLCPAARTKAGYRMYGDAELQKLQQILLFRELAFPLKEIRRIMESPDYDRDKALRDQIALLELKKEHLEKLIAHARRIRGGYGTMDFDAFDDSRLEEYAKQAREKWGDTPQYGEFAEKHAGRTKETQKALAGGLMEIFARFGKIRDREPACAEAQELVAELQAFITKHYYTCTKPVLAGLGKMYGAGGAFTENIDRAGGEGTAEFASAAIEIYCA